MSQNSKWWWEQIWFCHAGMLLYRIFFNNWGLASLGRHIIYIMKRLELPSVRDCEHPQIRSHICMRTDWSFWLCWGSEVDKQFMWELSREAPGLHRFDLRETVQSGWVTWSIALKPHWTSTKPDIPSWCYCSYHVFLIMHRILKHFGKRAGDFTGKIPKFDKGLDHVGPKDTQGFFSFLGVFSSWGDV